MSLFFPYYLLNLKQFLYFLFIGISLKRSNLLLSKSWEETQIKHSIWDSALLKIKDGQIYPRRLEIFRASISCSIKFIEGTYFSNNNVKAAFLGHAVYSTRSFILGLRKHKSDIEIICQACHCIYKLPPNRDIYSFVFPLRIWKEILSLQKIKNINKFKSKRVKGISKNFDATYAGKISYLNSNEIIKNQIFLHTFKDSPFIVIDEKRIFADYFDWISNTINIIKNSNEKWNLRIHPGAFRWGEDSTLSLKKILESISIKQLPENITINSKNSNLEIFKHCNRVITFSGNAANEAGCFGIKPITISLTPIYSYDKSLVHKPKTIEEYKKLLLMPSSNKIFNLNKNQINIFWSILFALEEQISIGFDLNAITLYRSDNTKKFYKNYMQIKKRIYESKKLKKYFDRCWKRICFKK